jgi:CheY-like chemotaxis protein
MTALNILLVEDEDPKRIHVTTFIQECAVNASIVTAKSVNSALDALEDSVPDLLLLDMSLPTFDVGDGEPGGRPQGFGGIEILRHMTYAGIDCPTLVITGYEAFPREAGKPVDLTQLRRELEDEFPEVFRGILHYNSTFDEWKVDLKRLLDDLKLSPGKLG